MVARSLRCMTWDDIHNDRGRHGNEEQSPRFFKNCRHISGYRWRCHCAVNIRCRGASGIDRFDHAALAGGAHRQILWNAGAATGELQLSGCIVALCRNQARQADAGWRWTRSGHRRTQHSLHAYGLPRLVRCHFGNLQMSLSFFGL